jgi:tetratricopeptide (TPR) repeat protein
MTAASLTSWWLWRHGVLKRIGPYPFGPVLVLLLVTNVFCRSTGALVLFLLGVLLLWLSVRYRTRLLLAGLLLVGPVYVSVRLTGLWSGDQAVEVVTALIGWDRAESLQYRFKCERLLGDHALQQPIFGWGGYGRNLVYWDEARTKNVEPDGMWIGTVGGRGLVGLVLVYLSLVLPAARFVRGFPARTWGDPRVAAASLSAALLGLYLVDCLMNAFVNIIYITMAGGLIGQDPRQLRALGSGGRDAEVAGRRGAVAARRAAVAGGAAGRALLADRCRTLGRSFKQEGRLDEADAVWRQALELLGGLIEAEPMADGPRRQWCDCANDLAWLRANHPDPARRDPASAVALAREATEACPDAAAYWNTLGAAHYRAGDAHAALTALERSRALAGGTAFDDVFLAMALSQADDPEGARRALARALIAAERDYPGHPELAALCDEARALIAGGAPASAVVG